jgi:hypothetical protein
MRTEYWDWPPTERYHRKAQRPQVELLEPREEQTRIRVEAVTDINRDSTAA